MPYLLRAPIHHIGYGDGGVDATVAQVVMAQSVRLNTAWASLLNDYNIVMLFTLDGKYAANPKKLPKPWALGTSTADIGMRSMITR